jgi:hypothetical protein
VNPQFESVRSSEILNTLRTRRAVRTGESGMVEIGGEVSFETLDKMLELMLLNDWEDDTPSAGTDRLRDGVMRKSATVEVEFSDLATPLFFWMRGSKMQSMSISLRRDQIAAVTMSLIGLEIDGGEGTQGTGTPLARTGTDPYNGLDDLAVLEEGGDPIARLDQVDIEFQRNLRPKWELGEVNPFAIGVGKLEATASIRQHFGNLDLWQKLKAFEDSSFRIALEDQNDDRLGLFLPRTQYTDGMPADVPGEDQDVFGSYDFEAVDEGDYQVEFTRVPGAE